MCRANDCQQMTSRNFSLPVKIRLLSTTSYWRTACSIETDPPSAKSAAVMVVRWWSGRTIPRWSGTGSRPWSAPPRGPHRRGTSDPPQLWMIRGVVQFSPVPVAFQCDGQPPTAPPQHPYLRRDNIRRYGTPPQYGSYLTSSWCFHLSRAE
jgi:hypothetical protein